MKHKLLLTVGIVLMALVGCVQDVDVIVPQAPAPDGAIAINISGSIDQTYTTRVDDGGFCDGDQIGLYGVNYTDNNTTAGTLLDEGNQVDNARYTYDGTSWSSQGSIYYKDAETNIDLYAYYPYAHPESVSAYAFEVAEDQSGAGTVDGYGMSDFLWGKTENVAPTEAKVKVRFSHRMAGVQVVLAEGDGFESGEFEALSKGVLVMNTTRTAEIDLSTGKVTATGEASLEGIVMKSNAEGFRAIVVPQSVAAGEALFSITVDGIGYRFKKDADFDYKAGMLSKFTIKINKKKHSGTYELALDDTEIVDWVADLDTHGGEARQYYVVHLDEVGTLGARIKADGKNPAKIKNLKVSGNINADDFYFIRDNMDIIQAINMKEAEIVASWFYRVDLNDGQGYHKEYFTGEMPESEEARRAAVRERYPEVEFINFSYYDIYSANEIPNEAFVNKSTLINFVFPEYVTKIGYNAFYQTTLSGALIIPDDVVEIENGAFYRTNISSLQFPHSLKILRNGAFSSCSSLSGSLNLPESLEYIGDSCFSDCSMLSGTLTIPSKITIIPSACFSGCKNLLGDLIIPEGVKEIGVYTFLGCNGLNGRLSLPKSLTKIGDHAFNECNFQGELYIPPYIQVIPGCCFRMSNFSSIVFDENSELVKIEESAFGSSSRLSEPVILPKDLLTIGGSAFAYSINLPSITIPEGVTTIGSDAFRDCYYLSEITCEATTPPVVGSGAFDGVPKDNFSLVVPEQSVALYQTATGWSDFKRVGAYYDFSISRKHLRVLNAEHSEKYLLRVPAGEPWSIESQPEWVTVTPSSGVGRTEVEVTVSVMARTEDTFSTEWRDTWGNWTSETHKGRAGEIVFLLENKDHRVKMAVEQYDYDYGDGDMKVNQTATKGGGVNIVFMGDCFDARDIATGAYLEGIDEAIGYYFAIEPYKSYRDYFNVYTIFGMSLDSGMGTVNTIKDAKFGSQYSLDGITPNIDTVFEYALLGDTVEESNLNKTLIVMVENTTDYGGITYMWGDGTAIAICPMSRDAYPFDYRGIVQHEAGGHGFAKLGDEYIYHNAFIQSCSCPCCGHLDEFNAGKARGWHRNLSTNSDYNTVEWAHLFANPDYTNIVDMYEGGYFHTRGIYRSEPNSCMNNNVPYYSAISRQEMVERIMSYAGLEFNIDDFYANDVRDASNNDFVTRAMVDESLVIAADGGKQMPPKYMGDKPQLKRSNK